MRVFKTLTICFLFANVARAQDFSGYRTGNYTGVNSVFYNPANIADSRYRWDVNLFGISTTIGNNKASFNLKDIGRSLDGDSIKNKVFSEESGTSSGLASVVLQGPSVFFNLNKKSAVALTTRARAMTNIVDIDGKLAKQIIDDANNNTGLPYTISSTNNMVVNVNGWTEFGASYAREIFSKGPHYLKGGVTLKYLAGAANASINISSLKGTLAENGPNGDVYLTNATGKIGLSFGGINTDNFEADDLLAFKSTGFGADIGFVYEYRGDSMAAQNTNGGMRRDANKYKFRIGVALLDAGSIKYSRDMRRSGGYNINIGASQRFYLKALDDAGIDNYKDTLNKYPQFFTPDASLNGSSYTVALPSTLHLDADYNFHKGLYVNLAAQFALTNSHTNVANSQYYNAFTLTPRFENRSIGVYVPLSYNSLTNFTAGASFRFGPLFIGSGSILSAALGDSKQADFFIGFHFGSLQKKTKQQQSNQ